MKPLVAQPGRRAFSVLLGLAALLLIGCEDTGKKSAQLAGPHAEMLVKAATADVAEVKRGLPLGAAQLEPVIAAALPEPPSAQAARDGLTEARDHVQDLRVAKSTFFALALPDGTIVRSSLEHDDLAEKNLFSGYPELKAALGGYVESRGVLEAAAGVRGRPDGQWVAAAPIQSGGQARALYVTGWSWSAYAYRLETALRSSILTETKSGDKVPLIYVYVVVDKDVFGAPVAPRVNALAIEKLRPLERASGAGVWTSPIEIEGRAFGVALLRAPALGKDVIVAVLRSET